MAGEGHEGIKEVPCRRVVDQMVGQQANRSGYLHLALAPLPEGCGK